MKQILIILLLCLGFTVNSQCVSNQSFTITPAGPYSPGQVVTVDYTLGVFTQVNANWLHAFQISLGAGWTNLTPLIAPGNPGGLPGTWIWDLQHTYPIGFNFGPGWRFQCLPFPVIDWGTNSTGPFTMSFQVTVIQTCTSDNLNISMQVFDDCTTGGWNIGFPCCSDPNFIINTGTVVVPLISTSNINHY
jgi:hypothetical protein